MNFRLRIVSFCLLILCSTNVKADLLGTWSCVYSLNSGGDYPSDLLVTSDNGNTFLGVGRYTGTTTDFSSVTGVISGSSINFSYDYYASSYAATVTGTVSENQMSGQWSSNSGQTGPFVCNRQTAKRSSSIRIICNRSGDLLSAVCAATVGDADAPPRKTPTGTVSFASKSGFPAFSSSCQLQPTSFSPGVSTCSVSYTPPPGFPVGAAFPLDAVYDGDQNLEPSSTDHKLLMATCVGNSNSPCSGAIGLDFGNTSIGIIRNALSLQGSCGKISRSANRTYTRDKSSDCQIDSELNLSLVEELSELNEDQWRDMAESITNSDAKADEVLKAIRDIGSRPTDELRTTLENTLKWAKQIQTANQQYINKITKAGKTNKVHTRKSIPKVSIAISSVTTIVRNGKEKKFAAKLNNRAKRLIKVFKKANRTSVTIKLQSKVKRLGSKRVKKLQTTQAVMLY
jgi:hypothetical protein